VRIGDHKVVRPPNEAVLMGTVVLLGEVRVLVVYLGSVRSYSAKTIYPVLLSWVALI